MVPIKENNAIMTKNTHWKSFDGAFGIEDVNAITNCQTANKAKFSEINLTSKVSSKPKLKLIKLLL